MLEHLLTANPADFLPFETATPSQVLDAQFQTSLLCSPEEDAAIIAAAQQSAAKEAFLEYTTGTTDEQKKAALAKLDVPEAVKELVGMLTAYSWQFIEQAKELRGYATAKIVEETTHPDARIRLKALEMLGKITEVALFTERSEVKQVGMTDMELDSELKARLDAYLKLEKEVVEGEVVRIEEKAHVDQ